ncbi:MAG: hypothetical protein ACREO5_12675, partial [Candidatus Binatia bacterium]
VEYLALNSGTLGAQTLLSNEIQLLFSTGALAVTANLQGGDITMVSGGFNFFAFKLVARPEMKSAEELKGKRFAISRFGSATDFAVQAGLEKLGAIRSRSPLFSWAAIPAASPLSPADRPRHRCSASRWRPWR